MTRPLRILLVEDHIDTQHVMSRLLQTFKHDVKSASSIKSALALASSHPFDLVITDIGLPDGSGSVLMAQLRQIYNLSGIAISGFPAEQVDMSAGFLARLIKPITLEQLERAIHSSMQDPSA
jgi:two-component system CheB/CheR fusion protein